MPLISIIIPVYNGESTIQETICSIWAQTFQDYELIVVNDGSTDSTLSILQTYTDPRLRVISTTNQGLAATRNVGIKHALGKYISFIDADDLWTPDKLESQLDALLKDTTGASVAYSWTSPFEEGIVYSPNQTRICGYVYEYLLLENFIASGSNILVEKALIDEVGGFDEELRYCEDWEFYLRLAAVSPFVVVPRGQILYRITSTSMSSKVKMVEDNCRLALGRAARFKNIAVSKVYGYMYISLARVFLSRAGQIKDLVPSIRALALAFINHPSVYIQSIQGWNCMKSLLYKSVLLAFNLKRSDIRKFSPRIPQAACN